MSGDEAKRRALSHLRHEIRTSLTAIIGYSEDLLETIPEGTAPEITRGLREIKAIGDAMLLEVGERISGDALAALEGEELSAKVAAACAACIAPSGRVDPLAARLIALAEQGGMYLPIPILCRIQAAGVMLHNLLKGYSLEGSASAPSLGLGGPRPEEKEEAVGLPHRGGRVLVVDDNSINRDLLRQWLTRQGHTVEEAMGGEEALAKIRRSDYDLVLLDLVMPDRSGLEVLEALSQEGRLGLSPIIMLSASDEIDGVVRCIERGADDYVTKPFHMVLLKARIRAALELKWHRQRERAYLAMLKERRATA